MNIEQQTVPQKTYIGKTGTLKIAELKNNPFFDANFGDVAAYCQQNGIAFTGAPVAMYKTWNEEDGTTDVFVGFTVAENTTSDEYEVVNMAEGKACVGVLTGSYDGLQEAHNTVMEYMKENDLQATATVEEYTVGPSPDGSVSEKQYQTHLIYYL